MFKNLKIVTKISLSIAIIILTGIIILSSIFLVNIRSNSYSQASTIATEVSKGYASKIQGELNVARTTVYDLYNSITVENNGQKLNREQVLSLLESFLDKNSSLITTFTLWEPNAYDQKDNDYINKEGNTESGRFAAYFARGDNKITLSTITGFEKEEGNDYYYIPKKTKKPIIVEPYYYKLNGKDVLITSIVIPVLNDKGDFLGIIGASIDLSSLKKIVDEARPMGGYSLILTNKGTFVANSLNKDYVTQNIINIDKTQEEIVKKIASGENFTQHDKSMITKDMSLKIYQPIKLEGIDTLWSFASVVSESKIYDNYYKLLKTALTVTTLIIILVIIAMIVIIKKTMKPVVYASEHIKALANADFTKEIPKQFCKTEDEIGILLRSVGVMQKELSNLIKEIIKYSQTLNISSEDLSAVVEELSAKTANIDEAVTNIVSVTQDSSAASEEISASVEEVDSSMNELSQKSIEGSNNSNRSKIRATEARNSGEKAIEEADQIFMQKRKMMERSMEDVKVVNSIKVMADTIASIADQTNLLALNAAIEAARAGEQGKGFAVVAEEVRKLAEQSADAVANIQETIIKVQDAFKNSINTGNDILDFINKEVREQFDAYGKTSNQYYEDSDYVSNMSEEIAAMAEEVTATVGEVNEAIQNMARAAQKSNEQAETIKMNMDENTKAIEQVAITAQNQAEIAKKLNEMILKFKI